MRGGRWRRVLPSFWGDRKVHQLDDSAALAWVALFRIVDDAGRTRHDPVEFSLLVPRWNPGQWEKHIKKQVDVGLLRAYEVGGVQYLAIPNFKRHQKTRYPTASVLPPPDDEQALDVYLEDETPHKKSDAQDQIPYSGIYKLWNGVCGEWCPNVRFSKSDTRIPLVKKLWMSADECKDLGWWKGYFQRIAKSDFLCARNSGQTFRATFGWVLQPKWMQNILEGNYDNPPGGAGGKGKRARNVEVIEDFLKEGERHERVEGDTEAVDKNDADVKGQ